MFPCLCYYATVRRQLKKERRKKKRKRVPPAQSVEKERRCFFVFGPTEDIRGMDLRFLEPNFPELLEERFIFAPNSVYKVPKTSLLEVNF
jgi:hypothetical protein